jgi:ABC-type anion transport system duplicated permease subunit
MRPLKLLQTLVRVLVAVTFSGLVAWFITHLAVDLKTTGQALIQLLLFTTIFVLGFYWLAKLMKIDFIQELENQFIKRAGGKK